MAREIIEAGIWHFLSIYQYHFPNYMKVVGHHNISINDDFPLLYQMTPGFNDDVFIFIGFQQRFPILDGVGPEIDFAQTHDGVARTLYVAIDFYVNLVWSV